MGTPLLAFLLIGAPASAGPTRVEFEVKPLQTTTGPRAANASGAAASPKLAPAALTPTLAIAPAAAPQAPIQDGAPAAAVAAPAAVALAETAPEAGLESGQAQFDGAASRFKHAARRLWNNVVRDQKTEDDRAALHLRGVVEAHRAEWIAGLKAPPESLNGIDAARAEALLRELKKEKNPASGGRAVRNATYFKDLSGGQAAVVKEHHVRSEMGEGKVHRTPNYPKWESFAYRLDRFLGSNAVPPAVQVGPSTSAQLKIRAGSSTLKAAARDPRRLMDLSHVMVLDVLLGNPDRRFSENVLVAGPRALGIDWDLSTPGSMPYYPGVASRMRVNDVMIEPGERFWRTGSMPMMFAKSFVDRLERLDEQALRRLAAEAEIELRADHVASILAQRDAVLHGIGLLKQRFGADLIVLE